jgi:hypothetical protein
MGVGGANMSRNMLRTSVARAAAILAAALSIGSQCTPTPPACTTDPACGGGG